MNIGLFFDLRNPPAWRVDSSRLYEFTLEMCAEAERLGAHSFWFSEHHLFEDGYLTQPLTFAAAVAARTRRARIGTAIIIAPLYKPVQLAEEATIVDLISGGRLELGLGAGYRVPEYELFGADGTRRFTATDECVRALRALWKEGRITPQPAQARVPIWLGYGGPQGARRAGLLGEGLLALNRELLEPYRQGLIAGGHDPALARMSGSFNGWITHDPDGDWPMVAKHLAYQLDSYRRYMVEGTQHSLPKPVDPDDIRSRGTTQMGPFLYGTPQQVAARIRALCVGLPIETIFFWASIAGMPEKIVARHVQTICSDLAPLLAAL